MPSKNIETMQSAHENWNKRDFAACVNTAVENVVYTDHARGLTLNGRDKFRNWLENWARAFSDGRITNAKYTDAGDVVIAQFTAVGTNDGPLGPLKATGKRISLPFCEITQFDKQGRIVSGGAYYDQYSMLTQLGLAEPLPMAA